MKFSIVTLGCALAIVLSFWTANLYRQDRLPASTIENVNHLPEKEWPVLLAQSPFDDQGRLSCAYSALMIEYLNELSIEEIDREIEIEIKNFQQQSAQNKNAQSRKIQKAILKDLYSLRDGAQAKNQLQQAYRTSCQLAVTSGSAVVRASGLSIATIVSSLTLPLRWSAKFGVGVFTRKVNQDKGLGLYDLTQGQGSIGQLSTIGYQVVRAAFYGGGPWGLAALMAVSIDVKAQEVCQMVNEKNPREVRFCHNYHKIKKKEYDLSFKGGKLGVQLGEKLLKVVDLRSDEEMNPDLCTLRYKKKYRLARRAIERLALKLKEEGKSFKDISILDEDSGCLSLNVISEDDQIFPHVIDGFPVLNNQLLPAPAAAPQETCQFIEEVKKQKAKYQPQIRQMRKETMSSSLTINSVAAVLFESIVVEPVIRQSLSEVSLGRNIVLMIAPNQAQLEEYEILKPQVEKLKDQLKKKSKDLKKLLSTRDVAECERQNEKLQFDHEEFIQLNKATHEFQVVKTVEEFREMQKEARKAGKELHFIKTLKNKWEFHGLTSFNELKEFLTDKSVSNLVIVSHGQANGKLVDSRFNELPHNFLNWINPNLMSFSFFSCHSKNAVKNYGLHEKFSSQNSYHPIRYVGSVDTSGLFDEQNLAPLKALSYYLENIDREISLAFKGTRRAQTMGRNHLPEKPEPKVCSVELDQAVVLKGAFSVKLNGSWIGTLYPESKSEQFEFPCAWLQSGENSLYLEGSSLTEKSTFDSEEVRAKLAEHNLLPVKVSRRSTDQSISAMKFIIPWP